MTKLRYLTKSRFKLAVECPAKLYYAGKSDEYRDTMKDNEFLAMLADGGYQVGALAKLRYPEGIEINDRDHASAEAKTQEYLKHENVILFEPAIRFGDFFIRIDVLIKNANHFELIEVKAKSYNSKAPEIENRNGGIDTKMLPYIQDVAFQKWVLQQAIPDAKIESFLMMPDKAEFAPVDGINQIFKITGRSDIEVILPKGVDLKVISETLLAKVPMNNYVSQILNQPLIYPGGPSSLGDAALLWAEAYRKGEQITPVIGKQCGACQYKSNPGDILKSGFHECWKKANNWQDKDFDDGTVLDLWNFKRKQALINQGILKINQINREDIGDFNDEPELDGLNYRQRQWLQVNGVSDSYDCGGYFFDRELAVKEMNSWKFPYHLIDFETSAVALPFYKGMRPYEPLAFQFSHHVMEADGSVMHADEFLCVEPGKFPNYHFARALKNALDKDDGTVFMWSHHENTILSKIVEQLSIDPNPPEDADKLIHFIKSLIRDGDRAMFDLCKMAEKTYFHPDTKGSNSIKKVLPAILKTSVKLRETYSKPIYGAPDGIKSLNFSSSQGYTWIDIDKEGHATEPYSRLKQYAKELLPVDVTDNTSVIAEGGAAATAYARLQFEGMNEAQRERIKSALLRYCELDTLAMVMVVQAWREDCFN